MSKGDSHLFSGTSGAGEALIDEVVSQGFKISPEKVVLITRDPTNKVVWMETGNAKSGLAHIIARHGKEFNTLGISNCDIPNYVLEAVYQGNIIGAQGRRNPRTVYEFTYNGEIHRIAVQVSTNGYIVSANPRSIKE